MRRFLPIASRFLLRAGVPFLGCGVLAACSSTLEGDVETLLASFEAEPPPPAQDWHRGPDIVEGESGPARFVRPLLSAFRVDRCTDTLRAVDHWYRAPANDGYEAVLDSLAETLRGAGFGEDERLELGFLETDRTDPAWTPLSASLTMVLASGKEVELHGFTEPDDVDRCMLPINAPSCDIDGAIALDLDHIEEGKILVTEVPIRQVYRRALQRGAAAVVSSSLFPFNVDPTGADRHLDSIQFLSVPAGSTLPVVQISPRSYHRIVQEALDQPRTRLRLQAEVRFDERPLRTLVASIVGDALPDEAVAIVSHVQEPGANDNASGVAGLLEAALSTASLARKGDIDWPARTLTFIWGDEFRQSRSWLEATDRVAVAGISSDMTGQSRGRTGAIALLERAPDPGALVVLPPDEHTPWGAGEVVEEDLSPHGLNVIARCALVDVGLAEGGWPCADHPWEGGSDHDVFIDQGIPAVLFWHFTDFAYHTSSDRLPMVDVKEIRRTTAAIMATALAVADPLPGDLERYLATLSSERQVRVAAAKEAGDEHLEALWVDWSRGARFALRALCLGLDPETGEPR